MMTVRVSQQLGSKMCGWLAALGILLAPHLVAAQPVCSSNCMIGACTLTYSADGVVRDDDTGLPIAGAQITLLDAQGVSAAAGSYSVSGSRPHQCHYDYIFSLSVTAPGYETYLNSGYWTGIIFSDFEIRLKPAGPVVGHTVAGYVAVFQACSGRMRGVTVALEPLGLTTQTTLSGGEFMFTDVPPGDYILHVVQGCNPNGCWLDTPIQVGDSDLSVDICMGPREPSPTPTPTPFSHGGPTFTPCPEKTPCILGEQPLPCPEECGLGCGCGPCPDCPPGTISEPRLGFCECAPDPNFTPPPTSTPGGCFFPTPPLCPLGQTAQCVTEDGCDSDCSCVACDPCPEGQVYNGDPNGCGCVDPNAPTRTPTPTPNGCGPGEPTECGIGEYVVCGPDCACECLPCAECPPGLELDGAPNSCVCIDPRAPSERPTPTPTPFSSQTPPICPTRTPLSCDEGESTVCDTSVDPCGICECRAVPQQPSGDDASLSPSSSGGCGIAMHADGSPFSWSLLVIAAIAWRVRARRSTECGR